MTKKQLEKKVADLEEVVVKLLDSAVITNDIISKHALGGHHVVKPSAAIDPMLMFDPFGGSIGGSIGNYKKTQRDRLNDLCSNLKQYKHTTEHSITEEKKETIVAIRKP